MSPWKCAGCECEYQWNEPLVKHGYKFCPTCADDPEKLKKATALGRMSGGWWFALGILVGMMLTKILFCKP